MTVARAATCTAAATTLLAFCCCGALSTIAVAQDASISVTDTLNAEWRANNRNDLKGDDDYAAFINRFNLSSSLGGLTAQLRADSFLFRSVGDTPLRDGFRDDLLLERATLRFSSESWTLTGGDFYRQLGNGIVLSLRKPDETAVDVTLQGGQAEFKSKKHRATLFAARSNASNLDGVSQLHVDDVDDVFVGLSYEISPVRALKIETFGLFLYPTEEILDERSHSLSGGLTVEMPSLTDWLTLAFEGDVQTREKVGATDEGYAAYATANLTFDDLGFVIQGLYLREFEQLGSRNSALGQPFSYNRPPTLERLDQEVVNNRHVLGGNLQVEYYFFEPDLLLQASTTYRVNDPDDDPDLSQPDAVNPTLHVHGLIQKYFQEGLTRLILSGGWRDERLGGPAGDSLRTMIHGEIDYLQLLYEGEGGNNLSMHLQVLHQSRTLEDQPFERGSALLSLEWARVGSITFEFGYDTQNQTADVREVFYAGILTWNSLDFLELRLTGGTRRGGIRCIAGVCRNFPAFAGVQTTAILRF